MTTSSIPTQDWTAQLDAALPAANIPTLLMMLVHLTGDRRWLSERYQCTHIRGIDDHDSGGLATDVQQEVRDAARDAVLAWKAGRPAALPAPELTQLLDMLQRSVGEAVPASYGPMVGAWLGLDPEFQIDQKEQYRAPKAFHVVVIGAGVAGLCASIRLHGAGIAHTVIEKNAEVGGTWYENRYPGAGVDTPNHIYSYSFAKADWTRYFALREEIQAYFVTSSRCPTGLACARISASTPRWTPPSTTRNRWRGRCA